MWTLIGVVSILAVPVFGIITLVNLVRKTGQAGRWGKYTAGAFIVLVVAAITDPSTRQSGNKGASPSQLAGYPENTAPAQATSGSSTPESASLAPPSESTVSGPAVLAARVTRVVDGDTVEVQLAGGGTERVRFIGIDTPEDTKEHEYFGPEATAATIFYADGKDVWMEKDVEERDRYGRLLAYVWLSQPKKGDEVEAREKMLNAILMSKGFAQVMTIPPNVKYADLFVKLQQEAREQKKGMWPGIQAGPQEPASSPAPAQEPPSATTGRENCDPSYPTVCIPPPPPDLDCGEIAYRRFAVVGADPHGFDRDRDGVGCES